MSSGISCSSTGEGQSGPELRSCPQPLEARTVGARRQGLVYHGDNSPPSPAVPQLVPNLSGEGPAQNLMAFLQSSYSILDLRQPWPEDWGVYVGTSEPRPP